MAKKMTLQEKAKKILEAAEKSELQSNYFFVTTFKRYQVQIELLEELEKAINEDGTLVEKEYVKGRKNIYSNPAIVEYNRTASAANKTVETLMKIINSEPKKSATASPEDELMEFLRG